MNKFDILNKIGVIINELQDQYDYTDANRDHIDDLELELFVANAHFLTDHIEILRKLNSQHARLLREDRKPAAADEKQTAEPFTEARHFEPVAQPAPNRMADIPAPVTDLAVVNEPLPPITDFTEPEKTEEAIPEPVVKPELFLQEEYPETAAETEPAPNPWAYEAPADEVVKTAPEPEANPWAYQTPVAKEPLAQPEPEANPWAYQTPVEQPVAEASVYTPEPVKTPVTTYEAPAEHPKTINEMISAQRAAAATPVAVNVSELPPITDLKSAINLNDKLLYVRDLFNGYSMAYGEAIEILNRFNKFDEADQFLKANYYSKNKWEEKQSTADKFYLLLQRRFPV